MLPHHLSRFARSLSLFIRSPNPPLASVTAAGDGDIDTVQKNKDTERHREQRCRAYETMGDWGTQTLEETAGDKDNETMGRAMQRQSGRVMQRQWGEGDEETVGGG